MEFLVFLRYKEIGLSVYCYSENQGGWAHERITTAATEIRDALKSFLAKLKADIALILPKVADDKEEMKNTVTWIPKYTNAKYDIELWQVIVEMFMDIIN